MLTRDHEQLVRAIERFQGRKFDYTPRNALEDRYANYPTEVVERVRRQVSLSALQGLSVKLGALREGRKAIVLVSEGYVALLPPQMRGAVATMPGVGNPDPQQPVRRRERRATRTGPSFIGELDVQSELQRVFDAANRSNTAIYAVDPARAVDRRVRHPGQHRHAHQPGRRCARRRTRCARWPTRPTAAPSSTATTWRKGMQQLVRDSSAYYLLGYNSTQSPSDGKFHEIKVRVKRPGMQVRARKGYWALTADRDARGPRRRPSPGRRRRSARSLAGIAGGARPARSIRTWVGTAPAEGGKTRVTFVWEAIPPPPGSGRAPVGRVMLTALDAAGDTVSSGAGRRRRRRRRAAARRRRPLSKRRPAS